MSELTLVAPHANLMIANEAVAGEAVETWAVSLRRGNVMGVGARVSGKGAWVGLTGSMNFTASSMEKSTTYDQMKKSYNIGGGVSAFWSWIGVKANADAHKSEIHEVFKEVANSQTVNGSVNIAMSVTGLYPGMAVTASAYLLVLQITDSSGNTYTMASDGDPASNTGAQDQNGHDLPTSNNTSTIQL